MPNTSREILDRYGRRLREIRTKKGLTQQELAERAGVVFQTVGKLERGDLRLRIDQLEAFAAALDVELWELLSDQAAGLTIPVHYLVAGAFAERVPAWDQPSLARVAAPPRLKNPEICFAAEIGDDSADRLYPKGSTLFVRPLDGHGRDLAIGTKVLVARFSTDAATGDIFEVLVGILDKSSYGDLTIALRSTNRNLPASIVVQQAPAAPRGVAERFMPTPSSQPSQPEGIHYSPDPGDSAEILGVVVMAVTPE